MRNLVDEIIQEVVSNTESGNWIVSHVDLGVPEEEWLEQLESVATQLAMRVEVLDVEITEDSELDILVGTDYCFNYREEE